jgi:hypothetical protein
MPLFPGQVTNLPLLDPVILNLFINFLRCDCLLVRSTAEFQSGPFCFVPGHRRRTNCADCPAG